MKKLALDDDILLNIEKPARYIGHEVNSVMKDKKAVDIRFAMCFPEVYEVGMSHLGIQILYDMFNRREDTWCERVYSPWIDLDKIMREKHIPLFALAVSYTHLREKLMKEYEEKEKPERKKRILLTGCPSSGAPMKVVKAIEEHGGNVVVYENCGGAKSVDRLIDEDAEDIYKAIAERYLAIGCSVMTPDNNRICLLYTSRCV